MGKCVSKDQHLQQIREIDERAYISISDEFEYYHYEVSDNVEKVFWKIFKYFTWVALDKVRRFRYIDSKDDENFKWKRGVVSAQVLIFLLDGEAKSGVKEFQRQTPQTTLKTFHNFPLMRKKKNFASHFSFSRSFEDIESAKTEIWFKFNCAN